MTSLMRAERRPETHTLVLVEGPSDRAAVEALANRRGRQLAAEGVAVVAIGGAHAIGRVLDEPAVRDGLVRLAGLCDAREEPVFRRALDRAGFDSGSTREELERLGFYVCDADLEDELIRALGVVRLEALIAGQGELGSFRTLQKQPAHRGRPVELQLRRFIGTTSGRKIRYGRLLVDALQAGEEPRPLVQLLDRITAVKST